MTKRADLPSIPCGKSKILHIPQRIDLFFNTNVHEIIDSAKLIIHELFRNCF